LFSSLLSLFVFEKKVKKGWNQLLEEESSLVHIGGVLGDVHITKTSGSPSNCDQIVKAMVAVLLSSNAATISQKTTQTNVFESVKSLLDHISSALVSVRDLLPESCSPEVEELLLGALQKTSSFDCAQQAVANKYMLEDSEPFRVFTELLKVVVINSSIIVVLFCNSIIGVLISISSFVL
jgi:hypothetical protein